MGLGGAIVVGICTGLLMFGVSDGGSGDGGIERTPPPTPSYSDVRGVALAMLNCLHPHTVHRGSAAQQRDQLLCSGADRSGRRRSVPLFTYVRARHGRTYPGETRADHYFVNKGVVVLPTGPSGDPGLPALDPQRFAQAVRERCQCGQVVRPRGL